MPDLDDNFEYCDCGDRIIILEDGVAVDEDSECEHECTEEES